MRRESDAKDGETARRRDNAVEAGDGLTSTTTSEGIALRGTEVLPPWLQGCNRVVIALQRFGNTRVGDLFHLFVGFCTLEPPVANVQVLTSRPSP